MSDQDKFSGWESHIRIAWEVIGCIGHYRKIAIGPGLVMDQIRELVRRRTAFNEQSRIMAMVSCGLTYIPLSIAVCANESRGKIVERA